MSTATKFKGLTQIEKDILFATPGTAEKYHLSNDQVNGRRFTIKQKLKKLNVSIDTAKKMPVLPGKEDGQDESGIERTPKAKMAVVAVDEFDKMFSIEETPPPLPLTNEEQKAKAMVKIKQMAKDCPGNGAIIIPTKYKSSAMKMLAKEFATAKWKVYPIKDNPAQVRIYKTNFPSK